MLTSYSFVLLYMAFGCYILGMVSSLLLMKYPRTVNILQTIFSIIASISGILAGTGRLLYHGGELVSAGISSVIGSGLLQIHFDTLAAFFVLALSILNLSVSIYSISYMRHEAKGRQIVLYCFLNSLFVLSMLGVFTAGNMVLFLITWEIMSVASYFLVVFKNEKQKNRQAGLIYFVMTHVATAFLTIAFALIYTYSGSLEIGSIPLQAASSIKNFIFICLLLGFGTKAGIMPLHIWLPHAHPAAPSNVSALMSGIMIKTAIYGFFRFILGPLGGGFSWWGTALLILGAISTVLGVAYALMEHDIKRLLAFHSIENIGIIFMGAGITFSAVAAGNMPLAALAMLASLFHTINHAIFKGALFLGAGSIQYSTGTKDIEKLGGLIKKMPFTAVFFLTACLAISAIPPFNGFVSEWLTYQSLFLKIQQSTPLARLLSIVAVGALGMAGALAAACFVKCFGISFLGLPRKKEAEDAKEVPWTMLAGFGLLSALCLVFGLFSFLMTVLIDKVNIELLGTNSLQFINGKSWMLLRPLKVNSNSVSSLYAIILVLMFSALTYIIVRLYAGKKTQRKMMTWDCGFNKLTSRMQYTATGFSKPIRIVFRGIFMPLRELEVEKGTTPYAPRSMRYIVSTQHVFEKYLYKPAFRLLKRFSRRIGLLVQTGSLHAYLIYVFAAVVILMAYYRIYR